MEVCIDANEKAEALKYIPKLADPRERAEVGHTGSLADPHNICREKIVNIPGPVVT